MKDSQINSSNQYNEVPATQKLTNVEIKIDNMCYKDFTESLCLYIQNKICIVKILNALIIMMNTNKYENEEKLYGILANLIRKTDNLYFTIICENHLQTFP